MHSLVHCCYLVYEILFTVNVLQLQPCCVRCTLIGVLAEASLLGVVVLVVELLCSCGSAGAGQSRAVQYAARHESHWYTVGPTKVYTI